MSFWNDIYSNIDPVAFSLFGFNVRWYGIAYMSSLFIALFMAGVFVRKSPRFNSIDSKMLNSYFIWIEIGIILGARFGYLMIYSDSALFYLTNPWQAFNPMSFDGTFVGISGMSYHGGIVGFLISSFIFARVKRVNLLVYLDLVALSVPLAYIFGRVGNFLNKELYGRVIQEDSLKFIGIYVDGYLRYPSQLIEAFLEGFVTFIVVYAVYARTKTRGLLMGVYALSYSVARFVSEFFREPDAQMGFYFGYLSMGQILSLLMFLAGCIYISCVSKSKYSRLLGS